MSKSEEAIAFACNEINGALRHCRIKFVRVKSQPGVIHWLM